MADPDWARVEQLARHRQLEKMKPGYWLRAELVYQDDRDADPDIVWCEIDLIMETESILTGQRLVRMSLWDPTATGDDQDASLCELRGSSRLSITAQQARSCRLPEK